MSPVFLGNPEIESAEWWAIRDKGLGGSEVAAVVGLHEWASAFSLWQRKAGVIEQERENQSMSWGKRHEPTICTKFAEDHPEFEVAVRDGLYAHAERSWQRANVDRMLLSEGEPVALLEAKTADKYDAWKYGKSGTDIYPAMYRAQCVWYLDVLELPVAHMAVLIGGNDYREYAVRPEPGEAEYLREQGQAFWQSVVERIPPPIDGSTATYEAVKEMHPQINGDTAEIPPALWSQYETTKQAAAEATTEHRRVKAEVLEVIGEAQYGEVMGARVLRRQPGRGGSVSLYPVNQPKEGAA